MVEPSQPRRFPHRNPPRPPVKPPPGQVSFRFPCNVLAVRGIFGDSGSDVSQLQRETATEIQCLDLVAGCDERVVVIVGSGEMEKEMIIINGEDETCEDKFVVSSAQEALFRVFEMIWEMTAVGGELCCRLLADASQIGLLLGKGGKNIERMRKESGAQIRLFSPPACAAINDKLIQLSGGILAVKKALFTVSCCLQARSPLNNSLQACPPFNNTTLLLGRHAENAASGVSSDPHAEFFPHLASSLPINPLHRDATVRSLPVDANRVPNQEAGSMQQEVVFRLLCSNFQAGGVIGWKGANVRALQNETGAFITFLAPITGWDERVVTISSLENLKAGYSPAQNAVLRVFARCIEADSERGPLSSFSLETIVTARLLVVSDRADCLSDNKDRVVSDINKETDVQILRKDGFLKFASKSDVIVQITGKYKNVQNALFQVTGKLRDALLPGEMLKEVRNRSYPFHMTPGISPSGRRAETPSLGFDEQVSLVQRVGHLGLSHGKSGHSSRFQPPQVGNRRNIGASNGRGRGMAHPGGGPGAGSKSNYTVQKTTMEIAISESVFSSVFGADGSNLEQMKQISGATVELRNPDSAGKTEGTVIISGTPDQAMAAQSLLQAFLVQG